MATTIGGAEGTIRFCGNFLSSPTYRNREFNTLFTFILWGRANAVLEGEGKQRIEGICVYIQ